MVAGIKILSLVMSLVIVSITEISPWVFQNGNAAENSVMLDAACFDSVHIIPNEVIINSSAVELVETTEISSVAVSTSIPEAEEQTTSSFIDSVIAAVPVAIELTREAEKSASSIITEFAKLTEEIIEAQETSETATEAEATSEAEPEAETETKSQETTENNPAKNDKVKVSEGKMLWPVAAESEIVSGYPYYSNGGSHNGVDIFVIGSDGRTRDDNGNSLSYGKPFRAAKDGIVVEVRNNGKYNDGFGNYCIIDHGDGTQTLYAHAKTVYVSYGEIVRTGQTIGEIGGTGNTTAPHLHFEVRKNGSRVDPEKYISNF